MRNAITAIASKSGKISRTLKALSLCTLLVATAGSASAYHLSPPGTNFILSGSLDILSGGYKTCAFIATGATAANGARATINTFASSGCAITGLNLPWTAHPTATAATIDNFTYSADGNVCGPKDIKTLINASGVWSITFKGAGTTGKCSILSGSLASSPAVTLAP